MEIKFIDRKTGQIKIESPPAEGLLKFLYDNPLGKIAILPLVKRKFISSWYGSQMDKASSKQKIEGFVKEHQIDLSESTKSLSEFTSFNDFFYRKLKPGARAIENGLVSPGDGRLLAFENVDNIDRFFVKGNEFSMSSFLENHDLAKKYEGASMFILRLAPNDYHRFHFPYEGIPSEIKEIKGSYFSVSPHAVKNNFARIFCENKREYSILSTQDKGDIVIAPVGATMVGSILETFEPGMKVEKGQEMGYFAFGGSSVVMLVEKGMINIDKDLLQNTANRLETYVQLGDKIAV
ncbi:MAG: phosphatidylserine decarboxylase [Leeuwenhoekiella sp.]